MRFSGGSAVLFCEQVNTVTSFFEEWNDCERTVVLYALLKRVPFANLKFLQLSIDYNLAQNYSSQSRLQLMETHANSANFLNKLVQRYQTTNCGDNIPETSAKINSSSHNNNNNNSSIVNNNLTASDSGYADSEKKNSIFDLSSATSSSSCSSTSGMSCGSASQALHVTLEADKTLDKTSALAKNKLVESKKDILNDILLYLPLLKPGNDDVKSVYMSLIPTAVEDACQQAIPTELVQHMLSYLLIHPAVNNDDRRSLGYWLRHLEQHIASLYIPTTATSSSVAAMPTSGGNKSNSASSNSNFFILPPAAPNAAVPHSQQQQQQQQQQHHQQQPQQFLGGSNVVPAVAKTASQQSLPVLANGTWHFVGQQQPQKQQQQQHLQSSAISGSCNKLPSQQQPTTAHSLSISSSSLLSKSQQSLNQISSSSSSSSSSCLDSTASQLLKSKNQYANLNWTPEASGSEESSAGGTGDATGCQASTTNSTGSMDNDTGFVPLIFDYQTTATSNNAASKSSLVGSSSNITSSSTTNGSNSSNKHHNLIAPSSQQQQQQSQGGFLGSSSVSVSSNATTTNDNGTGLNLNGNGTSGINHGPVVLADLDSSDDNHLSFSKNGTEIFDYDCDYDNEEEFKFLARAAAAAAAAASSKSSGVSGGGLLAAGSAMAPGSGSSKNRVSFDASISDYLRVPPIAVNDFDLDGSGLLKTRRSNSLTTPVSSLCGLPIGQLHQQKQSSECLSAENLTNLQLLQNKPRSFSLTMESPRSSLTSSGSETRLDDFKQHQMVKMYGQPNVGMSNIAQWLKSLRLHKYVWLFSNLTYEQMMEMTEEYLASLGVTKGARHKLYICIQKLKERYGTLVRLEKELLATLGGKSQVNAVLDELTNIVLTPMKPVGLDPQEDIAGQFLKLLELISPFILGKTVFGAQDEEFLNVYIWLLERALHNDAFERHASSLKNIKYTANKMKMSIAPKAHYAKNANVNGNINKPRWSVVNKHKSNSSSEPLHQKAPHRKSSLQYFSSPMQQQQQQQQTQPPQQQQQQQTNTSSSHSHLQAIPHQYYGGGGGGGAGHGAANVGTGHNNNYNKSSSYPNFASNMTSSGNASGSSGTSGNNNNNKHHSQSHPSQGQQQQQQQQHSVPPITQQQTHGPQGNFMYHRHSLNNISGQQFLQQLQKQQQQQQQHQQLPNVPPIFLSSIRGSPAPNTTKVKSTQPTTESTGGIKDQQQKSAVVATDLLSSKSQNNSIGDINSRLEFLCLQMTEQAIN